MVTSTAEERDIEINLRATRGALAGLPAYPQERWVGWDDDWVEVMARLEWVADLAEQGKLDADQQTEYERLLGQLRGYLPLTEQLDLPVPAKVREAIGARATKREVA